MDATAVRLLAVAAVYLRLARGGGYRRYRMPNHETIENIATSVAGAVVGGKVAEKLHLGGAGGMAALMAGSMGANDLRHKLEEKQGQQDQQGQ